MFLYEANKYSRAYMLHYITAVLTTLKRVFSHSNFSDNVVHELKAGMVGTVGEISTF